MKRVVLVDYGVGNLLSVARALSACDGEVTISGDPAIIAAADRLVLPGVGAYGDCMAELGHRGLTERVKSYADTGRPLLGICVGMQILFEGTEEFGFHAGLGLLPGQVRAIPATTGDGQPHKIPHIGWTTITPPAGQNVDSWQGTILMNVEPGSTCYFVHSFTAQPTIPAHRLADADYHGRTISAAVHHDNLSGTQFHPEKSGQVGLSILSAFLSL
ncbi:imidazole glycerol phosphate synthase subunit HisH [Insolitispirillum peregrinum]|uniref:imidazole glycerol phosphate synthase subunit HisH n=1 Tax=Insolitispirillum peregrinum TaxID=80876 RepID=UPI0036099F92